MTRPRYGRSAATGLIGRSFAFKELRDLGETVTDNSGVL